MGQPGPSLLIGGTALALVAVVGLALLPAGIPAQAANGPAVQAVEVRVILEGVDPPDALRDRLRSTVESVAVRLLVGRPVDQLRAARAQFEATIRTVITRVVTGFTVAEATIEPGPHAVVTLRLRPTAPFIRAVEVLPRIAVDPAVASFLLRPIDQAVAPDLRRWLQGLSVAVLDWAGPLIADSGRALVEHVLPGFTAELRTQPGAVTRVEIVVAPRDARVVRDIGVRFRSSSIPTIVLEPHAPQVLSMAEPIRGLPVAFAQAHRDALEALLATRLRAYPPVAEFQIVARPMLALAETTYVTVVADSVVYLGRVEAALSIGTRAPAPEIRAHLGRRFGSVELFGELALAPSTLSTLIDAGLQYRVAEAWDVGVSLTLNTMSPTAWVVYRLTPDLGVRGSYDVRRQTIIASVRYRFTQVWSGEFVGTSRGEVWLRAITNL